MDLCERFGWTLEELDAQDASRVLPGLRLANVRSAIKRVRQGLDAGNVQAISQDDLAVCSWAQEHKDA